MDAKHFLGFSADHCVVRASVNEFGTSRAAALRRKRLISSVRLSVIAH
jgi:hypothetical protein